MRNKLIAYGKYTDAVDEVLLKIIGTNSYDALYIFVMILSTPPVHAISDESRFVSSLPAAHINVSLLYAFVLNQSDICCVSVDNLCFRQKREKLLTAFTVVFYQLYA